MSQFLPRAVPSFRAGAALRPIHATRTAPSCVSPFLNIQCRAQSTERALPGQAPRSEHKVPVMKAPQPPRIKTIEELEKGPYMVLRTPYQQLPVYRDWKSGGNRKLTLIRRIHGDRQLMATELAQALNVQREEVAVNPRTQAILIKGDRFEDVKNWLLSKGF